MHAEFAVVVFILLFFCLPQISFCHLRYLIWMNGKQLA